MHLRHVLAIHLDTRAIRTAGLASTYINRRRRLSSAPDGSSARGKNIKFELFERWPWEFLNYTYNLTHGCWSLVDEGAAPRNVHGNDWQGAADAISVVPGTGKPWKGPWGDITEHYKSTHDNQQRQHPKPHHS